MIDYFLGKSQSNKSVFELQLISCYSGVRGVFTLDSRSMVPSPILRECSGHPMHFLEVPRCHFCAASLFFGCPLAVQLVSQSDSIGAR